MKQNVTDMKIAVLVKVVLTVTKDLFVRLTEVFFSYLLLLVKKRMMPPETKPESYAPDVVKGKAILFTFLASFFAVFKGQRKCFLVFVCCFYFIGYSSE